VLYSIQGEVVKNTEEAIVEATAKEAAETLAHHLGVLADVVVISDALRCFLSIDHFGGLFLLERIASGSFMFNWGGISIISRFLHTGSILDYSTMYTTF